MAEAQPAQAALDVLHRECSACTACGLAKGRTHVVPGEGPARAQVLFIGEGPGYHEDQQARPFVGAAGQLLTQLIEIAGLKRSDVYITNVVKCRPPNNREPLPGEIEACRKWLDSQIEVIRPRVIVTLGRFSLARFIPSESISKIHGTPRRYGGVYILPMLHPAAALYRQSLRKTLEEDFKKLPSLLAQAQADGAAPAAPTKPPEEPRQIGMF
ncbi:MAG: uracil-DNA glycosylase [Dehalococcoidia bacterium]|nr:uracil-DNA glycosylase [Dehalococcoidia bacterium]